MKKIMITLSVIALAAVSQAAAFQWKTKTGQAIYAGNTTDTIAGTAYLFAADAVAQSAVYDAWKGGSALGTLSSVSTGTVTAGKVSNTSFSYDGNINAFFAIVNGENLYISDVQVGTAQDVGTATIQFSEKATSQLPASTGAYSGAGWYSTAAVPEPTSGLLMLLGMAGLALRRRRA